MPSHGQPSIGSSLDQLLDRLANDFEDAWQSAVDLVPQISVFLNRLSSPSDIQQRIFALGRLIPLDLEHRWRRAGTAETSSGGGGDSSVGGELVAPEFPPRPLVEHYLKQFPELGDSSELLVELVMAEARVRSALGETLVPDDYLRRFPNLGSKLRPRLGDGVSRTPSPKPVAMTERMNATIRGTIGRYEINTEDGERGLLGAGGFGVVYSATDPVAGRRVAIKVVRTDQGTGGGNDPRYEARRKALLREARRVGKLKHPGIVPLFDVGETDVGTIYLVYPYLAGGDLKRYARSRELSWERIARIVRMLAKALHYMHRRSINHFDIKPANILMSGNRPLLTDFGLARLERELLATSVGGTLRYMSPEQARGNRHQLNYQSDIYSLGVVFYELLTGQTPYHAETPESLRKEIVERDVTSPRRLQPAIPQPLEEICLRSVARDKGVRYRTAADMARDLGEWLKHIPKSPGGSLPQTPSRPLAGSESTPVGQGDTFSAPSATSVRFRGLDIYGPEDSQFFLQLLPGDGVQLPGSLVYWKTKIDSRHKSEAFSIGLLSGECGSGKSSFLRAGLLPRLATHVRRVCINASPRRTTSDLRQALEELGLMRTGESLVDVFREVSAGCRLRSDEKLFVVLDQFEQYLNAQHGLNDELIEALRHCDGVRLQVLLTVREGFSSTLNELRRELDLDWNSRKNSSAMERFGERHAAQVLERFGRAIARLPNADQPATAEQQEFLSLAAERLLAEQAVSPVNIALFVETVRERDWSRESLEGFAGPSQLGLRLLEERFDGPRANPVHKHYRSKIVSFLTQLLPESLPLEKSGSPIERRNAAVEAGEPPVSSTTSLLLKIERSQADVATACGLTVDSVEFNEVLQILTSELPLVAFVESQEIHSGGDPSRLVRLTHDSLVLAVREWINRNEAKSPAGRARIALRERSFAWTYHQVTRELPSLSELFQILRYIPKDARSDERHAAMLRAARRHHAFSKGMPLGILLLLALVLAIGAPAVAIHLKETNKALEGKNKELESAIGEMSVAKKRADDATLSAERLTRELSLAVAQQHDQLGRLWLDRGIRHLADKKYARGLAMLAQAARDLPADSPLQASIANHAGDPTMPLVQTIPIGAPVRSLAISPDGRHVVTTGNGHFAELWDVEVGEIVDKFDHEANVNVVAFSPDGSRIATGGNSSYVKLWDTQSRDPIGEPLRANEYPLAMDFSPDGHRIVAGGWSGRAKLWDVETGLLVSYHSSIRNQWKHEKHVTAAAFSPDGRLVVTGSGRAFNSTSRDEKEQSFVRLWSVETGELLGSPWEHGGHVGAVAFSPDGRHVVTGCDDGYVRLWNVADGKSISAFDDLHDPVTAVAYSPDGRQFVTGYETGFARLWDALKGRPVGDPWEAGDRVLTVKFSPDGRLIATGCQDGFVRLWDCETSPRAGEPQQFEGSADSVSFGQDGSHVVAKSDGNVVRILNAGTGKPIGDPLHHDSKVTAIAFGRDFRQVVTGCNDGSIVLWDVEKSVRVGQPCKQNGEVKAVAIGPAGVLASVLASKELEPTKVFFWESRTGQRLENAMEHDLVVSAVAFTPDGQSFVTGFANGVVRLWDFKSRTPIGETWKYGSAIKTISISPDGSRGVIAGTDNSAQQWDLQTGAPLGATLKHRSPVTAAAFSPDGHTIVIATSDGEIHPWTGIAARPYLSWWPADGGLKLENGIFRPLRFEEFVCRPHDKEWYAATKEFESLKNEEVHQRLAAESEGNRNWLSASFHLRWLLKVRTDDSALISRLADVQAEQEHWEESLGTWNRVLELQAGSLSHLCSYGLACLGAGNRDAWREIVERLADRLNSSTDPSELDTVPWLGSMGPVDASLSVRLVDLGRRAVQISPRTAEYHESLGAAQYRAGDYVAAKSTLAQAIRILVAPDKSEEEKSGSNVPVVGDDPLAGIIPDQGTISMRLFLALTCHRLGDVKRAESFLKSASQEIEDRLRPPSELPSDSTWIRAKSPDWQERLRWKLLRDEAEALIGPAAPAPEATPRP